MDVETFDDLHEQAIERGRASEPGRSHLTVMDGAGLCGVLAGDETWADLFAHRVIMALAEGGWTSIAVDVMSAWREIGWSDVFSAADLPRWMTTDPEIARAIALAELHELTRAVGSQPEGGASCARSSDD